MFKSEQLTTEARTYVHRSNCKPNMSMISNTVMSYLPNWKWSEAIQYERCTSRISRLQLSKATPKSTLLNNKIKKVKGDEVNNKVKITIREELANN